MRKGDLLRRRVEDVELTPSKDLSEMVAAMGRGGGFTAKKIAVGAEILRTMLRALWNEGRKSLSTKELLWEFGRRAASRDSLLWWAWKNQIPVYVPAIFDGAVGYQLWSFWQEHKAFAIDQFRDEAELADLVFDARETGALMIGGGVSKHHTIWWNQFRGGLDYAVYITTAPEWDGSLSGARVREGISWGKVQENAKQVTIEGDATAILPILMAAALGRSR